MARTDMFSGLTEFMAVADLGSFRAAAAQLRVTPAAISQSVKALEARVGMPLFLRTTRSVALTEAGAKLQSRLHPATGEITEALDEVGALRDRPAGLLRLSVPRIAIALAIVPILPAFRRAYPDIAVELDVNDESIDLASNTFDAGIRIGHFIERDMIAVRLTPNFGWRVLGSPSYFVEHGRPRQPEDLVHHQCIGYRFPSAKTVGRWHFHRKGRSFSVDVAGGLITNDHLTMVALARAGLGLAFTADLVAAQEIQSGQLEAVLQSFCRSNQGLYLYFPARSQGQPKLRAFIDFATKIMRSRPVQAARS